MDTKHLDPAVDDLMRPTPLFSVFIPVRNDASWLGGAIASILAQTYGNWELIIGDNASTDDVRSVVAVNDSRVRYRRWDEAVDVIASWNRTASLCRGTWMVPIGADDRLLPDALETFATAIRDRLDLVMVVAACIRLDQDGRPAAATWRFYQGLARVRPGDYDARSWIQAVAAPGQPPWNIGSVALKRSAVERLGGYFNPDAGAAADIEVVLRMAIEGPVRYLDKRVMIFTQRNDSDYRSQHRSARTDDQEETFLGRGLRIGLAAHESSRGPLSARERGWVHASIARSFMQRAAEHRALTGGQGRRGAWRDIVRASRVSPGTVLSPRGLIVVIGVLLFPDWVVEAANRLLRVSSS